MLKASSPGPSSCQRGLSANSSVYPKHVRNANIPVKPKGHGSAILTVAHIRPNRKKRICRIPSYSPFEDYLRGMGWVLLKSS